MLNNAITHAFDKYLNPYYLINGAKLLSVCIILVVSVIYLYLFYKKRKFFYTNQLRKHIETLISGIVMDEDADVVVPQKIKGILNRPVARQFAIDELILCKKNFSGKVAEKITSLYIQLGFREYSLQKLADKTTWHLKARGIQELYLMDQADQFETFFHYTNSKNEFVRMEAQIGVIHLTGFQGLRFLDTASYPITEWQQLKLLEQLRLSPKKEGFSELIPQWLASANQTVVIFALKLADEYQQFDCKNVVVACLNHQNESVRTQAITTLFRLADQNTAGELLHHFYKETPANQALILDILIALATENEATQIIRLLDHSNDTIKLKASIIITKILEKGIKVIEDKAIETPEPFRRILQQIKS